MYDDVRLRPMGEHDLPFVVREHRRYFPTGFFARLGPRFLTAYYRTFLTDPEARCVLAEADGEPLGYVVGLTDPAAHRDHVVRRHGPELVLRAAAAMLVRPWLAVRFLRTRSGLYARKLLLPRRSPDGRVPAGQTAVLTQVCVTPEARSCGLGSRLIDRFDLEAAAAGCAELLLVTASDDGAGPYYRKRGWDACDERCTPDGLHLTTYRRPVARHDPNRDEQSA